jgi:hypothetical protein
MARKLQPLPKASATAVVFVKDRNKTCILSMGIKAKLFTKFIDILSRYCPFQT